MGWRFLKEVKTLVLTMAQVDQGVPPWGRCEDLLIFCSDFLLSGLHPTLLLSLPQPQSQYRLV